jgi:hypothetical protein
LTNKNTIVRFGAMEAIEIGRFRETIPQLNNVANDDPVPALRVYAIQILAKFGDTSGRLQLISHLSDVDWPARAMAFWYLGRYGVDSDYSIILSRLNSEENPFVQAEVVLAALRLAPLDAQ